MKKITAVAILFFAITFSGYAQMGGIHPQVAIPLNKKDTSELGWQVSANFGFYFPNKYPANFYNGESTNENPIGWVLNNSYRQDEINRMLGVPDTLNFSLYALPQRMRYNPTIMVGFALRNYFRPQTGFLIRFNYVKLRANDFFTLEVPTNFLTEADLRNYPIWGVEERSNFDIGISQLVPLSEKFKLFFEGGFHAENTKVLENKIEIEGTQFSLINVYGNQQYVPNTSLQEFQIRQGGLGYGIFLGAGVKMIFNDILSLDPGLTVHFHRVKLTNYEAFRPSFNAYVRITYKNFFRN